MLVVVLNISWQQHITNTELYGDLPNVPDKVAARRPKLAGHCLWHQKLILWKPTRERMSQGRLAKTMVEISMDTGTANTGELRTLMQDRDE